MRKKYQTAILQYPSSPTLYPHQWSAIGNFYHDTDRAIKEIEFLFEAQWKNGMIPHIVFNEKEKTYFPSADFYDMKKYDYDQKKMYTIFHLK